MPAPLEFDYLGLFRTRRDYCTALVEMSREQGLLIATEDYTGLLALLGRKQDLLNGLDEAGRRRPQLWERWREDRSRMPAAQRNACEEVLAETEALLAELFDLEQAGADDLARRREETRQALESLSTGVRAHDAYVHDTPAMTHRTLNVGQ